MTRPLQPRAVREVASSSPKKPSSLSVVQPATMTSPSCTCSAATWNIQLSPGCRSTVPAGPHSVAPLYAGRMYGRSRPTRPIASWIVATPNRESRATSAESGRSMRVRTMPRSFSR